MVRSGRAQPPGSDEPLPVKGDRAKGDKRPADKEAK